MKCKCAAAMLGSVLLITLITAGSVFGQGTLATVTGEVTDPTGAQSGNDGYGAEPRHQY